MKPTQIFIKNKNEEMGVKEDFDLKATNALLDGNAGSNPRKGTKQDIIELFRKAY